MVVGRGSADRGAVSGARMRPPPPASSLSPPRESRPTGPRRTGLARDLWKVRSLRRSAGAWSVPHRAKPIRRTANSKSLPHPDRRQPAKPLQWVPVPLPRRRDEILRKLPSVVPARLPRRKRKPVNLPRSRRQFGMHTNREMSHILNYTRNRLL